MLTLLDIPDGQEDLFNQTNSCSDTKQLDDKSLKIAQCPWRSSEFTQLAHELDKLFEKNNAEKLGKRYQKNGKSFWLLRQISDLHEATMNVPCSLPRNCYDSKFLDTCDLTQTTLLQIKDEIDIQSILIKVATP